MVLTDKMQLATIGKFLTFSDVQKVFQVIACFRRMKEAYEHEYGRMTCICAECFTEAGWAIENRTTHRGHHGGFFSSHAFE